MTIETYTDERRQEILNLILEFYEESLREYEQGFDKSAVERAIGINRQHSFLLIIDGMCRGVIAGQEVKTPFNNEKVFQEIIWYISKSYRSKGVFLLNRAMDTLRREGFNTFVLTLMHNSKSEKLGKFYTKLGFVPFETHFIRRL